MRAIVPLLCLFASGAFAGPELSDRDITAGAALYAQNCASCHGAALEGQPDWQSRKDDGLLPAPPHDRTGHTWHHDSQLLFDYTALGGAGALAARGVTGFDSGMPAFAGVLSADEIWDILGYIRSTWPAAEQNVQDARNQQY